MTNSKKRVLILGGGFGGVYVAVEVRLERNVNLKDEMPPAKPAAGASRGRA